MTFTRGVASLAPGYLLTPLTGFSKEDGILTPGSTSCASMRPAALAG